MEETDIRYARAFGMLSAVVTGAIINLGHPKAYSVEQTVRDLIEGLARARAVTEEQYANG